MLVHLNEMESVSRRAMQIFARELDVAALVDRTISKFFIQVHTPVYPAQQFTMTESALA